MDDPIVGPNTPVRLQRACERNRLEKQFLIEAYERLLALVTSDGQDHATDEEATREEPTEAYAHASESEACGVGHG